MNIQNPGDWPLVNDYMCTCATCGEKYYGPKRSGTCWTHTSEAMQKMWFDTHK